MDSSEQAHERQKSLKYLYKRLNRNYHRLNLKQLPVFDRAAFIELQGGACSAD